MTFVERRTSGRPSLRYVDSGGARPTLLMLHGVLRRAEDFSPLFEALTPGMRVVAVDLRGHGDSDRAAAYLVSDYVDDAVAFVREEMARPVVIYGHSLGAMVAAAVAGRLPELVRGVVLEDPPFHTMGRNVHGTAWHAQFTQMREIARCGAGEVDRVIDSLSEIRLPAPGGGSIRMGDLRDRDSLRWSAQCLARVDPEALTPIIAGRWLDGYDVAQTLACVGCDTLILQADPLAGGAMTDEDVQLARSAIAKCRAVKFAGCGHLLHWLQPRRVAELVNEFVSQTVNDQRCEVP